MDELREKVIKEFYKYNKMDKEKYSTDNKACFYGLFPDKNIPHDILKNNLDHWLENFDLDDQETFLTLFSHFQYIPINTFQYMVACLVDEIKENLNKCDLKETLFVFVESPKGCKSGVEDFAVALWGCLKGEIHKEQLITQFSMLQKEKIPEIKSIIFIDDIIATGFSMYNNIEKFLEKFSLGEDANINFYIASLFITRRGKRYINKKLKFMKYITEKDLLKSAFRRGYIFKNNDLRKQQECVLAYEEKAGKEYNGKKYVMGFSESKLLIGFYYEIPNNTLSTFWRHTEDFTPLFPRSSEHAFPHNLTLKEITEKKKRMRNRAYEIKSMGG